jgi:membrane protein YqaA with SNARE-associated domain
MNPILLVFLVVLALNVIPAFAPPTWMVFSFPGFRFPEHAGWTLAVAGALAATLGRTVLAKMSRIIVRSHWLSQAARENVDALRDELQNRPKLTFALLLFFAFTPLPSNSVFIAYGLTTMSLFRIAIPFFLGRFVSYTFWTLGAAAVSRKFEFEAGQTLGYFSIYFVATQLVMLGCVYVFTRIDWKALIRKRKWKWIPRGSSAPSNIRPL